MHSNGPCSRTKVGCSIAIIHDEQQSLRPRRSRYGDQSSKSRHAVTTGLLQRDRCRCALQRGRAHGRHRLVEDSPGEWHGSGEYEWRFVLDADAVAVNGFMASLASLEPPCGSVEIRERPHDLWRIYRPLIRCMHESISHIKTATAICLHLRPAKCPSKHISIRLPSYWLFLLARSMVQASNHRTNWHKSQSPLKIRRRGSRSSNSIESNWSLNASFRSANYGIGGPRSKPRRIRVEC